MVHPTSWRPPVTGMLFIDDYRCTDWLLTIPLPLTVTLLVTPSNEATFNAKAESLGVGSALMVISGYRAEPTVTGDLTPHWIYQFTFMAFFRHAIHRLLVSLSEVTERETNEEVNDNI